MNELNTLEELTHDNCCNCMKQITTNEYNFYDCWCERCRNSDNKETEQFNFSDFQRRQEIAEDNRKQNGY